MFFRSPRPKHPRRRGVTLVEMLVTVSLLVLMMTIIVQIFGAATGAVSAARTFQDLDSGLRQIDATIRQDLGNLTIKKMIPPRDPRDNEGYFEYIENSFADSQGEDTDDCLRFTVKAPEGQAFSGRFYPSTLGNLTQDPSKMKITGAQYDIQKNLNPITIESEYAEVIYFLRNGNLYRRVLLVAPERQAAVDESNSLTTNPSNFVAGIFSQSADVPSPPLQTLVSWQGLNDLSAHPSPRNTTSTIILNTLGDLTNRENRYAAPRFTNDFATLTPGGMPPWSAGGDGTADDQNADTVADFVPSLYFNLPATGLLNEVVAAPRGFASFATVAFPYVYPYAYSVPDKSSALGWIHNPDPSFTGMTIAQLQSINHSPLEYGDSLPFPTTAETWWGFPTWRETMSPNWMDPWVYVGSPQVPPFTAAASSTFASAQQAQGLNPFDPSTLATKANSSEQLPPMTLNFVGTQSGASMTGVTSRYRTAGQIGNDPTKGWDTFAVYTATAGKPADFLWRQCWEDDLILTGVRSFDVKAYDNSFPGYVDLGWGDDGRLLLPYNVPNQITSPTPAAWAPPLLGDNSITFANRDQAYGGASFTGTPFVWPPILKDGSGTVIGGGIVYNPTLLYGRTFAHEGRIPPLIWDNRADYQAPGLSPNIGDNSGSTIRLRRTWDSWSTDYSYAPSSGVNSTTGQPYGLATGGLPIYPSYPPPYPQALRGIQIQIRAVDPRNEKVKVLTIKQDFSDRL